MGPVLLTSSARLGAAALRTLVRIIVSALTVARVLCVVAQEATGGAKFDKSTDGGEESAVCTVVILNDDDKAAKLAGAMKLLRLDADALSLANEDYAGQIKDCFTLPEGGLQAKVMHVLTFPWQLLFAIVPPPGLCSGWPCFFLALIAIGFQVMLISDFASAMGCQMYLPDTITAITFVALGTSLPDTFASMQAARGDKYADNSIGNVTGSNSVNVFFGLGLPWLIGSIYWASGGADAIWHAKFATWEHYAKYSTSGAFVVKKTGLGLAVVIFTIVAIVTIFVILARRFCLKPPQELGGNKTVARASAAFLTFLWLVYVFMSCLAENSWPGGAMIDDPF
jgi:hypothetical protein